MEHPSTKSEYKRGSRYPRCGPGLPADDLCPFPQMDGTERQTIMHIYGNFLLGLCLFLEHTLGYHYLTCDLKISDDEHLHIHLHIVFLQAIFSFNHQIFVTQYF